MMIPTRVPPRCVVKCYILIDTSSLVYLHCAGAGSAAAGAGSGAAGAGSAATGAGAAGAGAAGAGAAATGGAVTSTAAAPPPLPTNTPDALSLSTMLTLT